VWAPVLDAPETFSVYVIRLDEAVAKVGASAPQILWRSALRN
jgi:hypothetical protein